MIHLGARLHAFVHGFFQSSDESATRDLYQQVRSLLADRGLLTSSGRKELARSLAEETARAMSLPPEGANAQALAGLALALFDYESLFVLPNEDLAEQKSVSKWWAIRDQLNIQKDLLNDFDGTCAHILTALASCYAAVARSLPDSPTPRPGDIGVRVPRISMIKDLGVVVEHVLAPFFDEERKQDKVFPRLRRRLEGNLIAASGGNPDDPRGFQRAPKWPSQSDIRDPEVLVGTYVNGGVKSGQ